MGKVKVYTRFTKSLHQTAFSIPDASFSPLAKIKFAPFTRLHPSSVWSHHQSTHTKQVKTLHMKLSWDHS